MDREGAANFDEQWPRWEVNFWLVLDWTFVHSAGHLRTSATPTHEVQRTLLQRTMCSACCDGCGAPEHGACARTAFRGPGRSRQIRELSDAEPVGTTEIVARFPWHEQNSDAYVSGWRSAPPSIEEYHSPHLASLVTACSLYGSGRLGDNLRKASLRCKHKHRDRETTT